MKRALAVLFFIALAPACRADGVSLAVRRAALSAIVYVTRQCPGSAAFTGTGFAYLTPGQIVTARHVVGNCSTVSVDYETAPAAQSYRARVVRVLARGDLALLDVSGPPQIHPLQLAPPPPNQADTFDAIGYQNSQTSAGDLAVSFSVGSSHLNDILPDSVRRQLANENSAIDTTQSVLRFNAPLQPGMSGGPIIDGSGRVIGIVAGGLKSGAAPASWGWPSEWVNELFQSNDPLQQPVSNSAAFYSYSDIQQIANARSSLSAVNCGGLSFHYEGRKTFANIAPTADDQARLDHIVSISTQARSEIDSLEFDLWVNEAGGATVVVPAGVQLAEAGGRCIANSSIAPIHEVVWSAKANGVVEIQQRSLQFEQQFMGPLVPYPAYQFDPQLTTTQLFNGQLVPAPQIRDGGLLVFNRKGFMHAKPDSTAAHSFETLIAKSGTFLGVGTINDNVSNPYMACVQSGGSMPGCDQVISNLHEWTRFILSTQLSTYPSY